MAGRYNDLQLATSAMKDLEMTRPRLHTEAGTPL